jgi:hypothetical protein
LTLMPDVLARCFDESEDGLTLKEGVLRCGILIDLR